MSVTNFKKKFIHRFLVNAVLLAIFSLLLSLGFWQLHRADEKKIILQGFAEQQKQSALNWNGQKLSQFTPIHMQGRALKTIFYLDNQFYQHKIGYHLIVPVMDQWANLVLVDLGWVPAKSSRAQLPKVDIPNWQEWGGFVFYPKLSKLDLGHFLDRQIAQNYVIEHLDVAKIEKLLKRKVMPWILRASSNPLRGVVKDWPLVSVKPERHYAYALQWFLMAAVILIVLIWRWKK